MIPFLLKFVVREWGWFLNCRGEHKTLLCTVSIFRYVSRPTQGKSISLTATPADACCSISRTFHVNHCNLLRFFIMRRFNNQDNQRKSFPLSFRKELIRLLNYSFYEFLGMKMTPFDPAVMQTSVKCFPHDDFHRSSVFKCRSSIIQWSMIMKMVGYRCLREFNRF